MVIPVSADDVEAAAARLRGVIAPSPLQHNGRLWGEVPLSPAEGRRRVVPGRLSRRTLQRRLGRFDALSAVELRGAGRLARKRNLQPAHQAFGLPVEHGLSAELGFHTGHQAARPEPARRRLTHLGAAALAACPAQLTARPTTPAPRLLAEPDSNQNTPYSET